MTRRLYLAPMLCCCLLGGETEKRFSASVSEEGEYIADLRTPGSPWANLAVASSSILLRDPDRWTLSASVYAVDETWTRNQAAFRVREAYGRVTLGDFDFTAGKRILRWSVGYAFTPAGILDPIRIPTNPTDRLNVREGRDLVSAEYIKGRHSLTAVYATGDLPDKVAFRYNAMIAGFDSSLIYAKDVNGRSFGGANFTRVIGEAVEVHGEYGYRAGASAAVIGGKYALRSGVGFIGEYYWAPGPARRGYTFFNVGKSRLRNLPGWKEWDVSASIIAVSDGGVIGVFDVSRRFGNHLTAYVHAETPGGSKTSQYAMIPYAAITSFGIRVEL